MRFGRMGRAFGRLGGVGGGEVALDPFLLVTESGSALQAASYVTPIQEFNSNIYVGWISSDLKVMVSKSTDAGSTWTHSVVDAGPVADDAHNVTSIGIDEDGFIHCAYNMHVNELNYSRSTNAEDISAWTALNTMGLAAENDVTYPQFYVAPISRQLHFTFRRGTSSSGTYVIAKQTDAAANTWTYLDGSSANILSGTASNHGPYPQNLSFTGADDDIILTWAWLSNDVLTGIFYAKFDRSANEWVKKDGTTAYTLPITFAAGEQLAAISGGGHGSQFIDTNGDLHVALRKDDAAGETEWFHILVTTAGVVTTTQVTQLDIPDTTEGDELSKPNIWAKDGSLWMLGTTSGTSQEDNFLLAPGDAFLVESRDGLTGALWKTPVPVTMIRRGAQFNIDQELYERTGDVRLFAQTTEALVGPVYVITEAQLMAARLPAVDIRYMTNAVSGTDASTYTFNNQAIGFAAADRKVLVGVGYLSSVGGVHRTVTGVTVGGIAATQLITSTPGFGGQGRREFWIADVPTETTGAIVVTLDGGAIRAGIGVWAVYNGTVLATASSQADPGAATMTVPKGGAAAGYGLAGHAAQVPVAAWSDMTERFDATVEGFAGHSGADMWAREAGSYDFAANWTDTPNTAATVFVTFEGAA